MKFVIYKDT